MVGTWERKKNTQPGQQAVPKPRKLREKAAVEWAEKAATNKKKFDEWADKIATLASMEQHIQVESQQAMSQAARPLPP